MPEFKSIRKHFSKFMINDILNIDELKKQDNENEQEDIEMSEEDTKICDDSSEDDIKRNEDNEKTFLDFDGELKKPRQCFTNLQVEELEKLFITTNYPDTYTRQQLAQKMEVSETRIQIWFQNRRAKIRRQKKHRRSLQGPEFLYQYRNPIDHLYKPPPIHHRYSSPPIVENFYRHSLNLQHLGRCHTYPKTSLVTSMHPYEPKLINPAYTRVCSTNEFETRGRSYTQ